MKILLSILGLVLLTGSGCLAEEDYSGGEDFNGYPCTEDCSGHEAGYSWAEDNDIDDIDNCEGKSDSFIEGCQSYVEENY